MSNHLCMCCCLIIIDFRKQTNKFFNEFNFMMKSINSSRLWIICLIVWGSWTLERRKMNLKDIFSIFIVVFVYLQLSTQKVIPVVNESFEDCTENGKIQMIDFSQLQFYNKDNESELMAFWGSLLFIIKIQNVIKHGPQIFWKFSSFMD